MERIEIEPIGLIHSCFTEKFGIPRQPGMVKSATARLQLLPSYGREEMVRGLEHFSHLWVHFVFHKAVEEGWRPTVRPPWLGGKKRIGVFATRSPHRPNHLGLSVVKLEGVVKERSGFSLELSGVDFLDQTPVIDIKPYVPYSDAIPTASCSYAQGQQPSVELHFSPEALAFCTNYQQKTGRQLQLLIEEMILHDPRPASQKGNKNDFGMLLWDVNIRWRVEGDCFYIETCEQMMIS